MAGRFSLSAICLVDTFPSQLAIAMRYSIAMVRQRRKGDIQNGALELVICPPDALSRIGDGNGRVLTRMATRVGKYTIKMTAGDRLSKSVTTTRQIGPQMLQIETNREGSSENLNL